MTLDWTPTDLPVEGFAGAIGSAIGGGSLVLTAEPGAGKSSLVPLIAAGAISGRVILLQPRRLAARATAARLADLLGQEVGKTVGLTIRDERTTSTHMRIEVVTEAILTNRLLADPELPGVGAVIFDEFHERSLDADLGLAMALESRLLVRPDLAIVVMSATIDAAPIARLLSDAPVIAVPGRTFPVETFHHERPERRRWADSVAAVTRRALAERSGDALVFVPGRGEVSRVSRALEGCGAEVIGLHGGTSSEAQRRVLRGGSNRRVIVATVIAETSVTVPGVTIVVDGGLARRPVFDPTSGLGALETVFVPKFGADQRRGRAGRTEAGACHRLWSREDERHLDDAFTPEILSGDPVPLALKLSRWGDPKASDLPLLDHPGDYRLRSGLASLSALGAVGADDQLTEVGHLVSRMPAHPSIAAALIRSRTTDGFDRLVRLLAAVEDGVRFRSIDLEAATASELRISDRSARRLRLAIERNSIHFTGDLASDADVGECLMATWPHRVALRREGSVGRFLTTGGTEVSIPDNQSLAGAEAIVVVSADGKPPSIRVRSAVAVDRSTVLDVLADRITEDPIVEWDDQTGRVVAARERRLGSIVLHRTPLEKVDPERVTEALFGAIRRKGLGELRWTADGLAIRSRLVWLHEQAPSEWPDMSDATLLERLSKWVDVGGAKRPGEIAAGKGLLNLLDWKQRSDLDQLAPAFLDVPSGSSRSVDYSSGRPVWSVRLQHLFGLDTHPLLGPRKVPVTIELLTPANRPAQTTNDLPGFWRGSYAAVRSDLRGRYPKHAWPEDPLAP